MAIWLLVFEVSLTALIGIAFWLSLFARRDSRAIYLVPGILLWLAASGASGALAFFSFAIRSRGSTVSYFPQAAILAGVIALVGLWMLIRGAMACEGELRAARWGTLRLVLAWVAAGLLQGWTVNLLDRRAKAFSAETRARATEEYVALSTPTPADADNAKDMYADAFAQMTAVIETFDREQKSKAKSATEPLDENGYAQSVDLLSKEQADRPEAGELLERLAPALRLIDRASLLKICRFQPAVELPDINDYAPAEKDHASQFRTACLALRARAVRACHHGQLDSAFSDVRTSFRLANHVDQTFPTLIRGLVHNGMVQISCDTLIAVLPYVTPTTPMPDNSAPDDATVTSAFLRDMRGEESLILGTVLNFGDGRAGLEGKSSKAAQLYRVFWLRPDVEITRASMAQERGLIGVPAPGKIGSNYDGSLLLQIIFPPLNRARDSHLETLCAVRQTRIALAITRYRLKHGTSPQKLQDLVPADLPSIPLDPFDGKPMKYRLEAGDAILYSTGRDQIDNGGQIDNTKDWGFRLHPLANSK